MALAHVLIVGAALCVGLLIALMVVLDRMPRRRYERFVATLSPEVLEALRRHEANGEHWTEFAEIERQDESRFS